MITHHDNKRKRFSPRRKALFALVAVALAVIGWLYYIGAAGVSGIPTQDMAMWESMGPIADRSHDKLGSSDRAIVEFRKIMLQQALDADSEPPAKDWRNADLFTFEGMVSKADDWRTVRPEAPVPA